MAKRNSRRANVQVEALDEAITQTLTLWHDDVNGAIHAAGERAVKDLVKRTKATAPKGERRGKYKKSITWSVKHKNRRNTTYVWHVKPPDHRLTHLLVKGHATRDGNRTKANPFLQNAVDQVFPDYLKDVEEALRNGK